MDHKKKTATKKLTSPSYVRDLLREHNIRIKKRFGQNFLIDNNILQRIVEAADLSQDDIVVEIGPGVGALTSQLADSGAQIVAVEIDDQLIPLLHALFQHEPNIRIVHGDALRIGMNTLLQGVSPYKVVANLPYYITSPLLMHFLEAHAAPKIMVVMMQAEVAQRLLASPGTSSYGALTIGVQYRAEVERILKVPRTVFYPQPRVDSAVVRLTLRPYHKRAQDEALFSRIVQAAFQQRRKMLRRSLKTVAGDLVDHIEDVLEEAGVSSTKRGEDLPIDDFVTIANILAKKIK